MENMKNLCAQIPESKHARVREEQEKLGWPLSRYVEMVLDEHFARLDQGDANGKRTMAFAVSEDLFQRIKAYLSAHKVGRRPMTQKVFVVELVEDAIARWERGEEAAADFRRKDNGKERTMAFTVSNELFQRLKRYLAAHSPLSQKEFVVALVEQALSDGDDKPEVLSEEEKHRRSFNPLTGEYGYPPKEPGDDVESEEEPEDTGATTEAATPEAVEPSERDGPTDEQSEPEE